MSKQEVPAIRILLVEDNLDDIELTKVALKKGKITNPITTISDGEEALTYLKKMSLSKNITENDLPGLILLDINLPKVSGIEILKFIKSTEKIKRIPVVILTTSKRDEDIVASYDLGVNSYIEKPVAFDKFVETIKHVQLYWALTNTRPVMDEKTNDS